MPGVEPSLLAPAESGEGGCSSAEVMSCQASVCGDTSLARKGALLCVCMGDKGGRGLRRGLDSGSKARRQH